jgi:hypothetical protein
MKSTPGRIVTENRLLTLAKAIHRRLVVDRRSIAPVHSAR